MSSQIFAGSSKTINGSFNPLSDNKTPELGALSLGAMTSPGALSGTTGIDVSLIHGDEWNQIEGTLTENVLKNHLFFVKLNETYTVNTNLIRRVNGTTNDTRVGVHNQTNIAPRNDEFMHTRSEIHHQKENRQQKTEDADVADAAVEFIRDWLEEHIFEKQYHGVYIEINGLQVEGAPISVENMTFKSEFDSFSIKADLMDDHFSGMIAELKACKLKAAGVHAKAIVGNFNAGVALNADSPFG